MTSEVHKIGSLEKLFNLKDALDRNLDPAFASQQADENCERQVVVTRLAKSALRLLANKSLENAHNTPALSPHYVEAFCRLLMKGKMHAALNMTRAFASRGADYGDIADGLFTSAARRMGDKWSSNTVSLVDVNIGVSSLVRTHIALCSNIREPKMLYGRTALFGWFKGQSHNLGIEFAAELFRQNGWSVQCIPAATPGEFLTYTALKQPDLVGMTATMDTELDVIQHTITRLRMLPFVPRIILGGSSPHLAALHADAIVSRLDMGLLAGHSLLQ